MNIHNATPSNLRDIVREFGVKAYKKEENGDYTLFVPENCEKCGKVCEGANSIRIPRKCNLDNLNFTSVGLTKIDADDELGCNDEGEAVCLDCY